ncbi:MAG: transaldolase family protein [Desulfobacterales bacterium]
MKAIQRLHERGQNLWQSHITRGQLNSGGIKQNIGEGSLSGLIFNPKLYEDAIKNSSVYDADIRKKMKLVKLGEELFLDLALEDIRLAADLLRPFYDQTAGVDGWVSFEVSPLIVHDTDYTLDAALDLYSRLQRPNLLIGIPGTRDGLPAVEEAIFAGVPVNVTLLFSWAQYLAAAEAFLRGIERRVAAGLKPNVASVASISVCRWDAAAADKVPEELRNQLGIAVARRTYKVYRELLHSRRWHRTREAGVRPQRLLWSDTEVSDADIPEDFYIKALVAPFTVVSMSERTLNALSDRDEIGDLMTEDGGDCEAVLGRFAEAGIDIDSLAFGLQNEEATSAVKDWIDLMSALASKSAALWQFA